ncbi:hypothetical protein [Pseudomonas aeruginosa]|uniref:hypothetical protein n=1 Tax=Pseudomonas aeruginosa TaxID=287 RepID=UPI00115F3FE8|nr:hypothetical protein [Pseudomonas aeruginosa]TRM39126.1 hypothetical protein FNL72_02825 [Pseudomonas aeruginosa]
MLSPHDFVPLEHSIGALRRSAPAVLEAIAKTVRAYRPSDYISPDLIISHAHGKPILGFAITYAQLSAYLDLAVAKYASVLIETDVGAIRSEHVRINRGWLIAQSEQVALLPSLAQAALVRSSAGQKASVTSLYPPLLDQTPEAASAELHRLKIRIERNLVLPGLDSREREIESLQARVASLEEGKSQAEKLNAAMATTLRMLTLENDQLRRARAEDASLISSVSSTAISRKPSNVELRNEAIREARIEAVKLATVLWASPDLADCRTGKMTQLVRNHIDPRYAALLPKTDLALARWLSQDAAPPMAKRRGRPPKSDPNK